MQHLNAANLDAPRQACEEILNIILPDVGTPYHRNVYPNHSINHKLLNNHQARFLSDDIDRNSEEEMLVRKAIKSGTPMAGFPTLTLAMLHSHEAGNLLRIVLLQLCQT